MKEVETVIIPAFLHHQQPVAAGILLQAISYNNINIISTQKQSRTYCLFHLGPLCQKKTNRYHYEYTLKGKGNRKIPHNILKIGIFTDDKGSRSHNVTDNLPISFTE